MREVVPNLTPDVLRYVESERDVRELPESPDVLLGGIR